MANKHKKQQEAEKKPGLVVDTLKNACVIFTASAFVLIFLNWLVTGDASRTMHPVALMMVFPFSLLVATGNAIFRYARLDTWLRVVIHYGCYLAGVLFCLYLPNRAGGTSGGGALIFFSVLTVVYAIVMGIILVHRARVERLTRDESTYTNVYKNK